MQIENKGNELFYFDLHLNYLKELDKTKDSESIGFY
jgi:hypothetical protein